MDSLRWTAHPARHRPREVALVAAVCLVTMGAVLASFHSVFLTLLAAAFLCASISAFLLPTTYFLSDAGVEQRRAWAHRSRAWVDLRRLEIGERAALVSPFTKAHWLDRHRGLVLLFDGADRDEVIEQLRRRIEQARPIG